MDISQLTPNELMLYVAAANAVIGFVLGLIPLVIGIRKGRKALGFLGLIVCVVGGAVAGFIISIPAAILFTWLVVKKKGDEKVAEQTEIN